MALNTFIEAANSWKLAGTSVFVLRGTTLRVMAVVSLKINFDRSYSVCL